NGTEPIWMPRSTRFMGISQMSPKPLRFLPIVCLLMTGCATSPPPLPQPTLIPALDPALAQPCPTIPDPPKGSYDAWQQWMQDVVLKDYGDCAARHAGTVAAW